MHIDYILASKFILQSSDSSHHFHFVGGLWCLWLVEVQPKSAKFHKLKIFFKCLDGPKENEFPESQTETKNSIRTLSTIQAVVKATRCLGYLPYQAAFVG